MSEIPKEFKWIKPGVQVELKKDAWHGRGISQTLTVITDPYLPPNFDHWVVECEPDFGLLMWCDELIPANNPTITLTLSREKAENCHEILGDVLHWGPSETLEWLREQIEEALK